MSGLFNAIRRSNYQQFLENFQWFLNMSGNGWMHEMVQYEDKYIHLFLSHHNRSIWITDANSIILMIQEKDQFLEQVRYR